jgi:hypothetical protein
LPPASDGSCDLLLADVPALGLPVRGAAGLSKGKPKLALESGRERWLLGALREHGELAPARAAMENAPLSVAEADKMLKELAEGGHLDVRQRGGGLFYAPWGPAAGLPRTSSGGGVGGLCAGACVVSFSIPRLGRREGA